MYGSEKVNEFSECSIAIADNKKAIRVKWC